MNFFIIFLRLLRHINWVIMYFGKKIYKIKVIKSPAKDSENHIGRTIIANTKKRKDFKIIFIEANIEIYLSIL